MENEHLKAGCAGVKEQLQIQQQARSALIQSAVDSIVTPALASRLRSHGNNSMNEPYLVIDALASVYDPNWIPVTRNIQGQGPYLDWHRCVTDESIVQAIACRMR
jgi:hypothetical protein